MRIISASSIIQSNNNFNLTRGCVHGCIYCDARSTCYQVGDFEHIAVKENALTLMEMELRKKRKKTLLTTGAMGDPYMPLEQTLCLMQGALKLIERYRFGIAVLTKSTLVLRDSALYEKINQNHKAIVQLTITTACDELAKIIEPHVSLPSQRFAALKAFADCGITTGIWMTPILPFISDTEENITKIVDQAAAHGVSFIQSFGMGTTMRAGSRDYFYAQLDRYFPGLKRRYIKQYGDHYICLSPDAKKLQTQFEARCEAQGIAYKHQAIQALFKLASMQQMTLF